MKQIYVLLTYKDKIIFGKCFNATNTYIWVFKKYPFTIFHCSSLWCILMWRFISPDCPKFFPHTWQLISFILLWTTSTCLCIAVFWTNALPQWKQTKSFLFRCDFCACSTGLSRPGISNKWSIWTFHFLYALPLRADSIYAFHKNVFHNCCTHIFAQVPHCEVFAFGPSYNPLYWKPSHTYHIWNFRLLRGSWRNVNQDFFYSHSKGDKLGMESFLFRVLNERC